MYHITQIKPKMIITINEMFDHLGEEPQILTPNSPSPLVYHNVMGQMTFVVRGTGLGAFDGDIVPLSAGLVVYLAATCRHAFKSTSSELELRHWHWPPELLFSDRLTEIERFDFPSDDRILKTQ